MNSQFGLVVSLITCLPLSSCSRSGQAISDSQYLPSARERDGYRFSAAQLERMAKTPLQQEPFVRYIEAKWPLARIESFCKPENRFPDEQNLVGQNEFGEIPLYGGQHDFNKIFVYVSEDDGKGTYFGVAGTNWKRWEYSLNILRGKDQWTIIESLPNDFMDNQSKYLPQ